MNLSRSSAYDFIKETFAPMIAVMHTPGVDDVCKKNNLNFIQLIKPFTKTNAECSIKDPTTGFHVAIKNLKVAFCDINARPPPPTVARSYFNSSISSNFIDKTTKIAVGEDTIDVPISAPWFEAWRDTFLQVQYPSEHEFTKHFVGCLIVISSLDPSPLEKLEELLEKLQGHLNPGPNKLPKWFGPSLILTTFLFLHDCSISALDVSVFEAMKVTYGVNKCFLLSLNSLVPGEDGSPPLSDQWAQHISSFIDYKDENVNQPQGVEAAEEAGEKSSPTSPFIIHPLSPVSEGNPGNITEQVFHTEKKIISEYGKLISHEDIERIKQFINDYCAKALIPHFEMHIQQLSDQISNKKGVSRSLFTATKRWFGSNKPGTPGNYISPTAIAYSSDSHELQLRKLGDLCFMIGQYSLAFSAYHSVKKDFGADGAWLHYAGALEMAALSAFMSNADSLCRKVVEYAEESILTYQNSCRLNQFATRATLLSVECLKARGLFGEAAKQLIRMSGEDSDLRSAVLLEQAAYCFLNNLKPVMHRKYAFHMVLAGHRYSKASHRNHSMRCYYQAYQVYGNKFWSMAEDHILYTVGKHAAHLKLASNAFEALSILVKRSSRQSPQQQEIYYKDYLLSVKQLYLESVNEVILSLPIIDCNLIQVALNISREYSQSNKIPAHDFNFNALSPIKKLSDDSMWNTLEEKLVSYANGSVVAGFMLFKQTIDLLSNLTDNSSSAMGFVEEPIGVCICLKNPLNIQINLRDIMLLFTMNPEKGEIIEDDGLQRNVAAISETVSDITLPPESTRYIMLKVTPKQVGELHINTLSYTLYDSVNDIKVVGQQPLLLKQQRTDRRLQLSIIDNFPQLEVSFSGLKKELICHEIYPFNIHLKNTGFVPISRILFTISENFTIFVRNYEAQFKEQIYTLDLKVPLDVNQSIDLVVYLQPLFEGTKNLDLLFYYESSLKNSKPSYRIIKHSWPTVAYGNIKIKTSNACKKDFPDGKKTVEDERIIRFHLSSRLFNSINLHNLDIESVIVVSDNWKIQNVYAPPDMKICKGKELYVMAKIIPADSAGKEGTRNVRFGNKDSFIPEWSDVFIHKFQTNKMENSIQFSFMWSIDVISMEEGVRKAYGQDYIWVSFDDKLNSSTLASSLLVTKPVTSHSSLPKMLERTSVDESLIIIKIYETPQACEELYFGSFIVPLTVEILNEMKHMVEVVVTFLPLPQVSAKEFVEDSTSDIFDWLGRTEYNGQITSNEKISFNAATKITAPGAYDVSARVNIEAFDEKNFPVKVRKGDCMIFIS